MPKEQEAPAEKPETTDEDVRKYELMVLIDPDTNQAQYTKHVEELKELVTSHGGSIWHEDEWGKRELAYTIKKKDYAYYVILNFTSEPVEVPKLEEQLRITNFIMRHLIVKVPENYTPQTYDLDAEPERVEQEEETKPVRNAVTKPKVAVAKKEEKPVAKAEPEEEPTKEDSKQKLNELDEKLEELLSGEDDLNL